MTQVLGRIGTSWRMGGSVDEVIVDGRCRWRATVPYTANPTRRCWLLSGAAGSRPYLARLTRHGDRRVGGAPAAPTINKHLERTRGNDAAPVDDTRREIGGSKRSGPWSRLTDPPATRKRRPWLAGVSRDSAVVPPAAAAVVVAATAAATRVMGLDGYIHRGRRGAAGGIRCFRRDDRLAAGVMAAVPVAAQ